MATATATLGKMYMDGKWCEASGGGTLGVINPATEEVIADIAYGGRKETRRAVEAAARAMPGWMKRTAWDRGKVLKKTAELMRERARARAPSSAKELSKRSSCRTSARMGAPASAFTPSSPMPLPVRSSLVSPRRVALRAR